PSPIASGYLRVGYRQGRTERLRNTRPLLARRVGHLDVGLHAYPQSCPQRIQIVRPQFRQIAPKSIRARSDGTKRSRCALAKAFRQTCPRLRLAPRRCRPSRRPTASDANVAVAATLRLEGTHSSLSLRHAEQQVQSRNLL